MAATRVAVFGGTGYLGGHIVRRLAGEGVAVRVAARRPEKLQVPHDLKGRVERVAADVRDEASLTRAVSGCGAVVNSVGLYVERGAETFEAVHVAGARNVARQAAAAGAERLVHISGIGADAASASRYVRARAAGEREVGAAFDGAAILRPSVLVGPGDAFLTTLEAMLRFLPVLPLFGRGETRLQPVFAGDVALAVARVLADPATRGRVFELGGASVVTYAGLIRLLLAHTGRNRWLLPVPFAFWKALARMASFLPRPPVTIDAVILMQRDNVVGEGVGTFADLGIRPKGVEDVLGL